MRPMTLVSSICQALPLRPWLVCEVRQREGESRGCGGRRVPSVAADARVDGAGEG
jgi:hypothetical protein